MVAVLHIIMYDGHNIIKGESNMTDRIRANFFINEETHEKVKEYGKTLGISQSAAYNVIISTFFRQEEAMKLLQSFEGIMSSDEDGKE